MLSYIEESWCIMSDHPVIKPRRQYSAEFKRRAVQMSYSSERPVSSVAESLGIDRGLLYRWRREYTPSGETTELSQLETENRQLRLRLAELEEENDILKKASALFAKHQG